jgi:hypothetical protein
LKIKIKIKIKEKTETNEDSNDKRQFINEKKNNFCNPKILKLQKDEENFLEDNSCVEYFEKPNFDNILLLKEANENNIEDLIEKYEKGKLTKLKF